MKDKLIKFKKDKKLQKQIFNFLIVGGIATVIDFLVFFLLNKIFNIYHLIAQVFAFIISVTYNYWASIKYVFEVKKDNNKTKSFILFITLSIVGLILTEILLYLQVDIAGLDSTIAKLIATAIVMVFNFITRKIFLEGKN